MQDKVVIKCPKSGEYVDVKALLTPFIFKKEDLEEQIESGHWNHHTYIFQEMLDKINEEGGKEWDDIGKRVIH